MTLSCCLVVVSLGATWGVRVPLVRLGYAYRVVCWRLLSDSDHTVRRSWAGFACRSEPASPVENLRSSHACLRERAAAERVAVVRSGHGGDPVSGDVILQTAAALVRAARSSAEVLRLVEDADTPLDGSEPGPER